MKDILTEIENLKSEYVKKPTIEVLSKLRGIMAAAQDANEASEGFRNLLTQLYPDNAHFIYELLQNAQDANKDSDEPSTVRFSLSKNKLEFEHNGVKLFDIKDVDAITGFGVSTKIDDKTNIGKFGVGFKSVFTITDRPEIFSGDYNFAIERLFIPIPLADESSNKSANIISRFIFPFNNPLKAVKDIEHELRGLGNETMLFLKNINKIEYLLPDEKTPGYIKRIENDDGFVKIIVDTPNEKENVYYWLKYEKIVSIRDAEDEYVDCQIAIAFKVEKKFTREKSFEWRIIPTNPWPGNVFIYFPAAKENSGLRFLINAPFASTVARDSIRDCEENERLCDAIAELVAESLVDIKNRELLTMDFLAVLPNAEDELEDRYKSIREKIVSAFQDEALVPTKSGQYAASKDLFRGPARINEVIDDDDLSLLTGNSIPLWAKNPQQRDSSREDQFLKSLRIAGWGYRELNSVFSPDNVEEKIKIENWLLSKSDQWLMRLYALLYYSYNEYDLYVDGSLRIVRTMSNNHVKASDSYFPPKNGGLLPEKINFVKPDVYDVGKATERKNDARNFLISINVKEYTEGEKRKLRIIKKSRKYLTLNPNVTIEQHLKDIVQFVEYEDIKELLDGKYFILDENEKYCLPNTLSTPTIYELLNNAGVISEYKKTCLSHIYSKLDRKIYDRFIRLIGEMGTITKLEVEDVSRYYNQLDYSIRNIEKIILALPQRNDKTHFSKLIWDAIIECKISRAEFQYSRPDGRYNFTRRKDPNRQDLPSTIIKVLSTNAWVPDVNGKLYMPQDISIENLHKDFLVPKSSRLLDALKLGENARIAQERYDTNRLTEQQEVKKREDAVTLLGVEQKDIEAIKQAKEEGIDVTIVLSEAITKLRKLKRPVFPEHTVNNPERRSAKVAQNYSNSEEIAYKKRERSVRTSSPSIDPKIMLRDEYTNEDGKMVCQICKDEMPFKGRDGKHYFESVEVFCINNEVEQNHLALCPLCAAKYKEFVKRDEKVWKEFTNAFYGSDDCEIPLLLGDEETSIRFTELHMHDLKTILLQDSQN